MRNSASTTRRGCLIGGGSLIAQSCARQRRIEFVPLVRLIAAPERYLNREVATVGYLYLGDHPRLSISEEDEINGRLNGVRADLPRNFLSENASVFDNKNVRVEGVLERSVPEDFMPLMRIERVQIWPVRGPKSPPESYWRRTPPS
jgi:hypothetical protein